MMTIKQAAELTGVSEHTLRAWERRYGAFRARRTPSGYRLYDEATISRIQQMQALVAAGLPPRSASAELARRGEVHTATPVMVSAPVQFEPLIAALAALDASTVKRVVDEQFARRDFEALADEWLMPALRRVGRAWADREISVAGEHLMSNIVLRRLSASYDAAGNGADPPVIVGAPTGVQHDLSLLAFAVCLRRAGRATLVLGHDVPADAWAEAVVSTGAVASVTAAYRRADGPRVAALATRLWRDDPGALIAVGGSHQRQAPDGCLQLGHTLAPAARELSARLAQS